MYLCPALRGIQAYSQGVRLRWVHLLFLLPVCPDPAKVFPPLTLLDSGDTIVGRQVWRGGAQRPTGSSGGRGALP